LTLFDFVWADDGGEPGGGAVVQERERRKDSIESRSTIITEGGGRQGWYWRITGGRQFGLPGPLDQDVS